MAVLWADTNIQDQLVRVQSNWITTVEYDNLKELIIIIIIIKALKLNLKPTITKSE